VGLFDCREKNLYNNENNIKHYRRQFHDSKGAQMAIDMNKDFEAAVRETREAFRPQTFAVGIWHGGEEQYCAFGRVSPSTARADEDTVFPIASVSKSFIAACAWMLADEGKLDMSAPVARYLPDFAMHTEEMTRRLTVRDTMCHCCGLPRHDITLFTRADFTLEEMVRAIRWLPPAWPMHSRFGYQNHMFAALSLLVERVSGMPWGDFVKKRVFEPLGMGRSYAAPFAYCGADDNYARPRTQKNGRNDPIQPENTANCGGAGSISASARDLLQWAKLNLRQGMLPNGGRLFSERAARQLHGEQTPIRPGEMGPVQLDEITGAHYGMGWFVERFRGERFVHHGGAVRGYKSLAGFMPEKDFAFVALANATGSPICEAVGRKLCDMRLGRAGAGAGAGAGTGAGAGAGAGTGAGVGADWDRRFLDIASKRREDELSQYRAIVEPPPPGQAPALSGLSGRYENKAYGVFTVTERGGRLRLRASNVKPMAILPSKRFEWAADLPDAALALPCRFEFEADGGGGDEGNRDGGGSGGGRRAARLLVSLDKDLAAPIAFERLP
jgi:CubicO group peptidase (beta-lactamase class C family)